MSVIYSFTCLTALALLTGCTADGPVLPESEKRFTRRKEQEVSQKQQLNASALNSALAFGPYRDLATRPTAEPGVQQQQQQQHNILFSPLGLASALALLSQVTGSESWSQVLGALGLAATSTQQSVEATISALADLIRSLAVQEEGVGGGVQRAESEAGAGTEARIGPTARVDVGDGAEDGVDAGGHIRVWSGLRVEGKHSLDYDSFLSGTQRPGPSALNTSFGTLLKDLQDSDKLELNNYVYFKGSLFFVQAYSVLTQAGQVFLLVKSTNNQTYSSEKHNRTKIQTYLCFPPVFGKLKQKTFCATLLIFRSNLLKS